MLPGKGRTLNRQARCEVKFSPLAGRQERERGKPIRRHRSEVRTRGR